VHTTKLFRQATIMQSTIMIIRGNRHSHIILLRR
jgi:hypothetical protein